MPGGHNECDVTQGSSPLSVRNAYVSVNKTDSEGDRESFTLEQSMALKGSKVVQPNAGRTEQKRAKLRTSNRDQKDSKDLPKRGGAAAKLKTSNSSFIRGMDIKSPVENDQTHGRSESQEEQK